MQLGAMETILPGGGAEAIEQADEVGFEVVELSVGDPDDHPVLTSAGRTDIRKTSVETGVGVPSLCLGWLNGGSLIDDDDSERAYAREVIEQMIDAAAAMDAEALLVPFFGSGTPESDEEFDRAIAGVHSVAPAAEAAGVTLALETPLSGEQDVELVEAVDSDAVGVYYDTGNPVAYGHDPVADLEATGEHLARVHAKDYEEGGSSVALGEGDVDFEGITALLDEFGYDDPVMLETPSGDDAMANARTNLEAARELFGG